MKKQTNSLMGRPTLGFLQALPRNGRVERQIGDPFQSGPWETPINSSFLFFLGFLRF
jgi:hypothetical protein